MQTIYEYGTDHWKELKDVIYNDLRQIPDADFDNDRIKNAGSFNQLCESVIYLYTVNSSLYENVNKALRNLKEDSVYGSYALMLNTILLNWPSIQVCRDTTYRGEGESFDVTNYVVGTIFTWTAFTSSSTNINVACDQFAESVLFIFNNDVHSSWSSKFIAQYSAYIEESECLYPSSAIFKVTAIERSSTTDNLCNRPDLAYIYISLQQGYQTDDSEDGGGNVIEGTAYTVVAAVIVAKYWFFI
ncbi:uncharacterized protein LOC117316008 [Pecten maximus]|uniref:uncharacterized protein LOC117316008 n=1 Tax=Pecten maximus TaxID=6579 RepID=UPI0014589414|nr:uncharacterized protein LOC117316008 [Pecten maximus]